MIRVMIPPFTISIPLVDPIHPNQCLSEHQQKPEYLLESTYVEVPVQGHFYSGKKMQYLEFYLTITRESDKVTE